MDPGPTDHNGLRALFAEIYAAFTGGDLERLASLFDADIVWHTPGSHRLSGTYQGREATIASFVREAELSNGSYDTFVREVAVGDDLIVASLRATAMRGERSLSEDYAIVFAVKDGRVVEAWEAWCDPQAVDAFWS